MIKLGFQIVPSLCSWNVSLVSRSGSIYCIALGVVPPASRVHSDQGAKVPRRESMPSFLNSYESIVLKRYFPVLEAAYQRARNDKHDTLYALEYLNAIERLVVPIADNHVRPDLYESEHLYKLLLLFQPRACRFTPDVSEEDPRRGMSTSANEHAWKELRNLLIGPASEGGDIDRSLPPAYWRPLVSHFARETILWAYVASIYIPDDKIPADLGGVAEWLETGDTNWRPMLITMMEILARDLKKASLPGVYIDLYYKNENGERVVLDPGDLVDQATALNDLVESGNVDPNAIGFAQIPGFEPKTSSSLDDQLDNICHLIRLCDRLEQEDAKGRLAKNDFSRKLLLRFAYTATTHLWRSVPIGNRSHIRNTIIGNLFNFGFLYCDDLDVRDNLGWLKGIRDQSEHFGDTFAQLLTKTTEDIVGIRPSKCFPPLTLFLESTKECSSDHPDLHAVHWLKKSELWQLTLSATPEERRDLVTQLCSADFSDALLEAITADVASILAECEINSMSNRIVLPPAIGEDRAVLASLALLESAYQNLITAGTTLQRRPKQIVNFFTKLCRSENKGAGAPDVMTVAQWQDTAERLCGGPENGMINHYHSVWVRLQPMRIATGAAVRNITDLADCLESIPGLPKPHDGVSEDGNG